MEGLLGLGLVGLFIGCFLAATVIPFSAEILLVGAMLAGCDPVTTFCVATLGNSLGSLTSYGMGYLGKWEWIEKYFHVSKEKLEKQRSRINKYGPFMAMLCWLPFIGDVFAIVLGFYKAPFWPSALWMFVGKCGRFVCWALVHIYLC